MLESATFIGLAKLTSNSNFPVTLYGVEVCVSSDLSSFSDGVSFFSSPLLFSSFSVSVLSFSVCSLSSVAAPLLSSDLLSFYNQTNETVNCYREYVREYNANTNQYSEWHSTDNTIAITDAVPQITPTSEWRLDAFDNTNTYTYQDLNIYTSDSFVVPTSGEINDATNTTSSIYIGIDNLENDLKTVSPAKWENQGNLDNYVNSMTHTVERGR